MTHLLASTQDIARVVVLAAGFASVITWLVASALDPLSADEEVQR